MRATCVPAGRQRSRRAFLTKIRCRIEAECGSKRYEKNLHDTGIAYPLGSPCLSSRQREEWELSIVDELTACLAGDRAERCQRFVARVAEALALPAAAVTAEVATFLAGDFVGGRQPAVERLAAIDPEAYGRTRNDLAGAVTRLSPWLRHGVLSLAEVRDAALARVREPAHAVKLISELGWRDYWQRVVAARPEAIWHELEEPAAQARGGSSLRSVGATLPADIASAQTGMACIDAFSRQLTETGWLHNHARMWLASWLVHVRHVPWQVGAAWFLEHLLDADPASNNFSWQWIAGTFSSKPYIFNRDNLERFTSGKFCSTCPELGHCDVEGGYEELSAQLFASLGERTGRLVIPPPDPWYADPPAGKPLVWLSLDALAATAPARQRHPDALSVCVLDADWLREERPSPKRLAFIADCLADIPGVEVWLGDAAAVLASRAVAVGASHICVTTTACPRVRKTAAALAETLPVVPVDWPPFCDASRVKDLGRFSRYWNKVSKSALQPTAG